MKLAQSALAHLRSAQSHSAICEQAIQRAVTAGFLAPMRYFYLYDNKGRNIMHPRQPELVGKDLMDMKDPYGGTTYPRPRSRRATTGAALSLISGRTFIQADHQEVWVRRAGGNLHGWMLVYRPYADDIIEYHVQQIDGEAQAHIQCTLIKNVRSARRSASYWSASAGLPLNHQQPPANHGAAARARAQR